MITKLFVGYRLTPELKALLSGDTLQTIPYQGKEYVGRYLETSSPTMEDVEALAAEITETLPALHQKNLVVFPQLFLG